MAVALVSEQSDLTPRIAEMVLTFVSVGFFVAFIAIAIYLVIRSSRRPPPRE